MMGDRSDFSLCSLTADSATCGFTLSSFEMAERKESPHRGLFDGRFQIEDYISSGSFGDVFSGVDYSNGDKIAVKLESDESSTRLLNEYSVYLRLQGGVGIPRVLGFGFEHDHYYLPMEYLGPSLEFLFKQCGRTFSLKTILLLADQIINRLEFIHSKGYVHGDIKPDNFTIRYPQLTQVYIIDFGHSSPFMRTGAHIPFEQLNKFIGSFRFASIYNHIGIQPTRRSDMESLCYNLIYFFKGSLPWDKIDGKSTSKISKEVCEIKKKCSQSLKDLPIEFLECLKYCQDLSFDQAPDYDYMKNLFKDLFKKMNFQYDNMFDWKISAGKGESDLPLAQFTLESETKNSKINK